jgi:hypothetical protein
LQRDQAAHLCYNGGVLRELTATERDAYFAGVHPIWGGGLAIDRFVTFQRRLADSGEALERSRLLGLFDGSRMLSAMKAYDLRGTCQGTPLRILGIGAVFTPPPLRRCGHARRMLELALADRKAQGYQAALLFSDIGISYYERLGFRALRSDECSADVGELPRGGLAQPAAPGDEADLARILAQGRAANGALTLARDGWVIRFQLRRLRELARARGVGEPEWGVRILLRSGEACAMLRLGRDALDVLDAGWTSDAMREPLLATLREVLLRCGRTRLRFWPAHQMRTLFPAQPRSTALAMVAQLDARAPLPPAAAVADLALLDHI